MLKRVVTLFFLLATVNLSAISWNEFEMPEEIHVTQRIFSFTQTFDIASNQYRLGIVHRKLLSLLPQYEFYDLDNVLQAKAKMRWLSFGATFDVTDIDNNQIAIVEEKMLTWFSTFTILSPRGEILATAKMNFWNTKYTVSSPLFDGPIAELSRPFLRLKDNWKIKVLEKDAFKAGKIDPRVFMVVMAYQTDREYWSSQSDDNAISVSFSSEARAKSHMDYSELDHAIADQQKRLKKVNLSKTDLNAAEKLVNSYLKNREQTDDELVQACFTVLDVIARDDYAPEMNAALLSYVEAMRSKLKAF